MAVEACAQRTVRSSAWIAQGDRSRSNGLAGVEPNRVCPLHKGVDLCKTNDIELILAVGGGSVLDCAKAVAVGAKYEGDMWDFAQRKAVAKDALPLGTVLTMAATGSEMNSGSVITNQETQEKTWLGQCVFLPSVLDS